MNYLLTEAQIMIQELARKIAEEKVRPVAAEYDEKEEFPWPVMKILAESDLFGIYIDEKYGGTGLTFDWNIIGHIGKRIFLAGGINPDNVAEAVKLGVYGVDICGGVEAEPGKKDHKKMKRLFENIRHLRG